MSENKKLRIKLIRRNFGAASQIRTGDLILTKDALYRLSYSSKQLAYYSTRLGFVNNFLKISANFGGDLRILRFRIILTGNIKRKRLMKCVRN